MTKLKATAGPSTEPVLSVVEGLGMTDKTEADSSALLRNDNKNIIARSAIAWTASPAKRDCLNGQFSPYTCRR